MKRLYTSSHERYIRASYLYVYPLPVLVYVRVYGTSVRMSVRYECMVRVCGTSVRTSVRYECTTRVYGTSVRYECLYESRASVRYGCTYGAVVHDDVILSFILRIGI